MSLEDDNFLENEPQYLTDFVSLRDELFPQREGNIGLGLRSDDQNIYLNLKVVSIRRDSHKLRERAPKIFPQTYNGKNVILSFDFKRTFLCLTPEQRAKIPGVDSSNPMLAEDLKFLQEFSGICNHKH